MYSLDNLSQGQIDRSPRNAGKRHINLPSEGFGLARRSDANHLSRGGESASRCHQEGSPAATDEVSQPSRATKQY